MNTSLIYQPGFFYTSSFFSRISCYMFNDSRSIVFVFLQPPSCMLCVYQIRTRICFNELSEKKREGEGIDRSRSMQLKD